MPKSTLAQMTVEEFEVMLGDHLGDTGSGVLARIDDQALLPGSGRHDVAVRGPGTCGEAGDQHPGSLSGGGARSRSAA